MAPPDDDPASKRERDVETGLAVLAVIVLLALLLGLLMVSCTTIQTLAEAPEEFWTTTWRLVEALLTDAWEILTWAM